MANLHSTVRRLIRDITTQADQTDSKMQGIMGRLNKLLNDQTGILRGRWSAIAAKAIDGA